MGHVSCCSSLQYREENPMLLMIEKHDTSISFVTPVAAMLQLETQGQAAQAVCDDVTPQHSFLLPPGVQKLPRGLCLNVFSYLGLFF